MKLLVRRPARLRARVGGCSALATLGARGGILRMSVSSWRLQDADSPQYGRRYTAWYGVLLVDARLPYQASRSCCGLKGSTPGSLLQTRTCTGLDRLDRLHRKPQVLIDIVDSAWNSIEHRQDGCPHRPGFNAAAPSSNLSQLGARLAVKPEQRLSSSTAGRRWDHALRW